MNEWNFILLSSVLQSRLKILNLKFWFSRSSMRSKNLFFLKFPSWYYVKFMCCWYQLMWTELEVEVAEKSAVKMCPAWFVKTFSLKDNLQQFFSTFSVGDPRKGKFWFSKWDLRFCISDTFPTYMDTLVSVSLRLLDLIWWSKKAWIKIKNLRVKSRGNFLLISKPIDCFQVSECWELFVLPILGKS